MSKIGKTLACPGKHEFKVGDIVYVQAPGDEGEAILQSWNDDGSATVLFESSRHKYNVRPEQITVFAFQPSGYMNSDDRTKLGEIISTVARELENMCQSESSAAAQHLWTLRDMIQDQHEPLAFRNLLHSSCDELRSAAAFIQRRFDEEFAMAFKNRKKPKEAPNRDR